MTPRPERERAERAFIKISLLFFLTSVLICLPVVPRVICQTGSDTLMTPGDTLATEPEGPITVGEDTQPTMSLDFKDADIRDILRAIGTKFGINLVVDRQVKGHVTVHLQNVPVIDGLRMLLESNGFALNDKGNGLYQVERAETRGKMTVTVVDGLLSLDVQQAEVGEVLREISQQSGISIVADQTVKGRISGVLYDVDVEKGLSAFLSANGFLLKRRGNIYEVTRAAGKPGGRKGLTVIVEEGQFVTLDVSDADVGDVLDEISYQSGISIVQYGTIRGTVNARLERVTLDEAFSLLLQGTQYTYRKSNDIYLIGDKSLNQPASQALTTSKLLKLRHIKAEDVPKILPTSIPAANVKVIKEQNAILVVGTDDLIQRAEEFLDQIDLVSPQVMIEALIVGLSENGSRELGMEGGYFLPDTTRMRLPKIYTGYDAEEIQDALDDITERLHIDNVGRLNEDFYIRLRALESAGEATVKARPKIATLNGNDATIDVGWVRYYQTTTGYEDQRQIQVHTINYGVQLKIVPWVSSSGEITTVISTRVSGLISVNEETGLPEIAQRTAETTIRLQDGETVIIGGLIQTSESEQVQRVPFLGSIPFLGRLFSVSQKQMEQNELVIYITPNILEAPGITIAAD
jgi:type IV pilus assembly protein PilQ